MSSLSSSIVFLLFLTALSHVCPFVVAKSCTNNFAIGHRGYSAEAPENTMPAFELAVRYGADSIETDLQVTKDGVIVLLHDQVIPFCLKQVQRFHINCC